MLHLETMNMMTKYQLVFIKLETAVAKMMRIRKMRNLMEKQKAFERYRRNTKFIKGFHGFKAKFILEKIKKAMDSISTIFNNKKHIQMAAFFNKWESTVSIAQNQKKYEGKIQSLQQSHEKIIKQHENSLAQIEQTVQHHIREISALKETEKSLKQVIKEKEDKEKYLLEALEKAKREDSRKQMPKNIEERLQGLETTVSSLEGENRELRERLEATEGNVGDFITEMTDLLDSQEFASILIEKLEKIRIGT